MSLGRSQEQAAHKMWLHDKLLAALAERDRLAADLDRTTDALDDAHHVISTWAGLLRLRGATQPDDYVLHAGNQLAAALPSLRAALASVRPEEGANDG